MLGYKHPNIDSGATLIGSASHAPDRRTNLRKNSIRRRRIEQGRDEEEEILSL
jgi:hypothetical protein